MSISCVNNTLCILLVHHSVCIHDNFACFGINYRVNKESADKSFLKRFKNTVAVHNSGR